jgi:predicted HicB family RNase H-like nuclease
MQTESNLAVEMARIKTLQFNMRMKPSFKRMAEIAAAAEHRSLASLIEKLLADHCRARGLREEAPKKARRS